MAYNAPLGGLNIFGTRLTTPTVTIPNITMGFCSDRPMNVPTKFEVRSFTRS